MNRFIRKIDPRYFILLFLSSFVLAGQFYLGFFQKWDAVFASVLTSTLTELIIVRMKHKKWAFPLSAFITGLGVSLLLNSYQLWPYVITAFLAIVIKFTVRINGKHIFNPNNVALVLMIFCLPQYAISSPKQWSNGLEIMVIILLLGLLAAYAARRLDVVLSFVSGFTVFAYVRHLLFEIPLMLALGPLLGAAFQLFTFFMITDPKTTPETRGWRIIFGVAVAFFDAVIRVMGLTNSQFYALFLVSLFIMLPYRIWAKRKKTGVIA